MLPAHTCSNGPPARDFLGTATADGTLHLGFRSQQSVFDAEAAEAAEAVADLYCGRLAEMVRFAPAPGPEDT